MESIKYLSIYLSKWDISKPSKPLSSLLLSHPTWGLFDSCSDTLVHVTGNKPVSKSFVSSLAFCSWCSFSWIQPVTTSSSHRMSRMSLGTSTWCTKGTIPKTGHKLKEWDVSGDKESQMDWYQAMVVKRARMEVKLSINRLIFDPILTYGPELWETE